MSIQLYTTHTNVYSRDVSVKNTCMYIKYKRAGGTHKRVSSLHGLPIRAYPLPMQWECAECMLDHDTSQHANAHGTRQPIAISGAMRSCLILTGTTLVVKVCTHPHRSTPPNVLQNALPPQLRSRAPPCLSSSKRQATSIPLQRGLWQDLRQMLASLGHAPF